MQKKIKPEKIILSAPKTAATLIISATLNIVPTVSPRGFVHTFKSMTLISAAFIFKTYHMAPLLT